MRMSWLTRSKNFSRSTSTTMSSPILDEALRRQDGVVGTAPGPKPIAVLAEPRVEDRLQDLQEGLLNEPVEHRRDAELTLAPTGLGDELAFHWRRAIAPGEKLLLVGGPLGHQVRTQLVDRHAVDARASLVLLHSPERGLQVRATQHAVQQVARSRGLTGPIRRRH